MCPTSGRPLSREEEEVDIQVIVRNSLSLPPVLERPLMIAYRLLLTEFYLVYTLYFEER
jgi:hypothetical protein